MTNDKVYSQHYSSDTTIHEDKQKFRRRILRYLEDFINDFCAHETNRLCRSRLGIDIDRSHSYLIVATFSKPEITIGDILDFLTIPYDAVQENKANAHKSNILINEYLKEINQIFQEESMCYVINRNGRVRYFPDEECHQLVKNTIAILNHPNNLSYLNVFNEVLDELYKHRDKESPIRELFLCVESFVLSIINDGNYKQLKESSVDKLIQLINEAIQNDAGYTDNDKEAMGNIKELFRKWVDMCHKYRHGKKDQLNQNVPKELFNFIFSTGTSIFRWILELNSKYKLLL